MSLRNSAFKTILNGLHYSGLAGLAGQKTRGLGAILMLHHVRDGAIAKFAPNAHLTVTPQFLDQTLDMLRKNSVDLVSMDEAVERISAGKAKNPFVAITFDDGYRDNGEIAAPILQKHGAPYTIYVATGLIDDIADLWWDALEAIIAGQPEIQVLIDGEEKILACKSPEEKSNTYQTLLDFLTTRIGEEEQRRWIRDLASRYDFDLDHQRKREMMTWDEIIALDQDPLCTIGAHTIHHYALARLDQEQTRIQVGEGTRIIGERLGKPPRHFAYPYGHHDAAGRREFDILKDLGFSSAVTTRPGVIYGEHSEHLTALPRISLNGHFQANRYTKTLLSGLPTLFANRMHRINVD